MQPGLRKLALPHRSQESTDVRRADRADAFVTEGREHMQAQRVEVLRDAALRSLPCRCEREQMRLELVLDERAQGHASEPDALPSIALREDSACLADRLAFLRRLEHAEDLSAVRVAKGNVVLDLVALRPSTVDVRRDTFAPLRGFLLHGS
jgi:hypothetical protein